MILDYENLFSKEQALTATANSTNIIDLSPIYASNTDRDIGQGARDIRLFIVATELFVSAGSSTLTVILQTDDNTAFSSPTTIWTSTAIPKASLIAGFRLADIPIPKGVEKALRLTYTVAVADFSAGKVTAGLVLETQDNKSYFKSYV